MAPSSTEIREQQREIIDVWTQALEDHGGEDANNVDEDIEIGEEEHELDCARDQTREDLTQNSATSSDLEPLFAAGMEKNTSHHLLLLAEAVRGS